MSAPRIDQDERDRIRALPGYAEAIERALTGAPPLTEDQAREIGRILSASGRREVLSRV